MTKHKPNIMSLGHTELILLPHGIVQVNASNRTYTVTDIKDIHNGVNHLMSGKKALLMLVGNDHTLIDSDARAFLSTPEASANTKANAYIIKSLAQRLLINFLIKVTGTPVPTKIFTETTPAIEWLKTFTKNG